MKSKRLLKGKGIAVGISILLIIIIAIVYWWLNRPSQPQPFLPDEKPVPQSELQVHFIDVGQGDSILIDLGSDEVLIDGGKKSPGVTDYISKYIDGPLEVMVATHPHTDHIEGLIKVLEVFQVEEIWLNGQAGTSKITYPNFMAAVNAEGAEVNLAKRNGTISTGDLNFSILNPPGTLFSKINNNSIVLRLEYGDIVFLFMGDAEEKAETSILNTGSELPEWITTLMRAYREYTDTLEAENAE